jgi:hypothetical protein
MRVLVPTTIAAALLAGAALPAAAATPAPPPAAQMPARGALPVADTSADRDSFTQKAEAEMRDWQRKFDDAAQSAKAKGEEGGAAASAALDHAWTRTKEASHQLESASVDGWEKAKADFQSASHRLATEWHKVYPGDNK